MPTRHFLDPKRPLLDSLVPALLERGTDLADSLVIVPTSHSGRRLRRALPEFAGRPVLAPRVQTPEATFRPATDSRAAANACWWTAWKEVLRQIPVAGLEAIFPQAEQLERDPAWALACARNFTRLKNEIAEIDRDFAGVARVATEDAERWNCLHRIDEKAVERLNNWGLRCPAEVKRMTAVHWSPPDGCRELIIACVPDAVPLAIRGWENAVGALPVTVYLHADEALGGYFDEWGQILPEAWRDFPVPLPGGNDSIQVASNARELALRVTHSCVGLENTELTLGVTDSAFVPAVNEAFAESGWPLFQPEGRPVTTTELWNFLAHLRALLHPDALFRDEVPPLLKSPHALYLLDKLESPTQCAREVDRLAAEFLPSSLGAAIKAASRATHRPFSRPLIESLEELDQWLRSARPGHCAEWLGQLLDRLEQDPDFPLNFADAFHEALQAIAALEKNGGPKPTPGEAFDLLLAELEAIHLEDDGSDSALDALGWLELAFERAPHLRLAGLHEGYVPEKPGEDGFLTESLRETLGLRGRARREARDAYLLTSLIEARAEKGSLGCFTALADPAGNAKQASRLLLRCPVEQLADRVRHCFPEEIEDNTPIPGYNRADWVLQLPAGPLVYKPDENWTLSPSMLALYLRCPLRFYLQRQLNFQREDFDKRELDAAEFGSLIHDVLEAFGRDPVTREFSSSDDIISCFDALLDGFINQRFGSKHSLALQIQLDSARRRLHHFAHHQAQARADGWRIREVELAIGPVPEKDETPWEFAGHPVKMRIDRVDQHEESGAWRVVDYKTGKATSPRHKHLATCEADEDERFQFGELIPGSRKGARPKRWAELQLPLYAEYARQRWGKLPEVGYAHLPPAASDSGFDLWDDYDDTLHQIALEWTRNAVAKIEDGFFEPRPHRSPDWDPFSALAPDSLADAIGAT